MATTPTVGARGNAPARKALAVTPSDTTVYNCRNLWVGSTGHVTVTLIGDTSSVTFSNVPAGTLLPVQAKYVNASTTASNIVAMY